MTDDSDHQEIADTADNRAAPRIAAKIGASMRQRSATAVQIALRDISVTGFRAEWPNRLRKDDLVWLRLPGLESLEAKVVWCEKMLVGCKFVTPLHSSVLDRLKALAGGI